MKSLAVFDAGRDEPLNYNCGSQLGQVSCLIIDPRADTAQKLLNSFWQWSKSPHHTHLRTVQRRQVTACLASGHGPRQTATDGGSGPFITGGDASIIALGLRTAPRIPPPLYAVAAPGSHWREDLPHRYEAGRRNHSVWTTLSRDFRR